MLVQFKRRLHRMRTEGQEGLNMKRMTLKSAAELIAERKLTNRLNAAMAVHEEAAKHHAAMHRTLLALALHRNRLLARSENTFDVDAKITEILIGDGQ